MLARNENTNSVNVFESSEHGIHDLGRGGQYPASILLLRNDKSGYRIISIKFRIAFAKVLASFL